MDLTCWLEGVSHWRGIPDHFWVGDPFLCTWLMTPELTYGETTIEPHNRKGPCRRRTKWPFVTPSFDKSRPSSGTLSFILDPIYLLGLDHLSGKRNVSIKPWRLGSESSVARDVRLDLPYAHQDFCHCERGRSGSLVRGAMVPAQDIHAYANLYLL